jgi:hypothetical protein
MQRILIAIPFILLPFFFGAIQPWHQAFVFSLFLLVFILVLWSGRSLPFPNLASKWILLLGIILIYPFFQAVPLPLSWLQTLSPERFFWLSKAGEVTGLDPA